MMRLLYSLLIRCAVPFALAGLAWRGWKERGYWQGLSERWGGGTRRGPAPAVWLHAVSLGEMSAAAPLVRALRSKYPHLPLVLTTATPTGRARAQALFGHGGSVGGGVGGVGAASGAGEAHEAVDVRFLPYDTPGAVARFMDNIRPRLAIIMETELWPNLFGECERRAVPVMLASARLSMKSVGRYRRFAGLFRGVFSANVSTAAQTAADAERFIAIGAPASRTHVIGNIKFDLQSSPGSVEQGRRLRAALGNARPIWIAGSTHPGEEEWVLDAHEALCTHHPDALLLLVPRHPARFPAVAELLNRRRVAFVRRSTGVPVVGEERATPSVMLVDTVGELAMLYAAVDVAFVGGSLVPIGGHNLLEPASMGIPVLTGPHYSNARDIGTLLLDRGAARQVRDAGELGAAVVGLFADAAERRRMGDIGRAIVEENRGSVARLLALIEPLLSDPSAEAAENRSAGH